MKERFFNIYHHLAGCFVPFWLLSRTEVEGDAKLLYAWLAQQANSHGAAQLHCSLTAATLAMDEGRLARQLMELEEVGLIRVSRGNVNDEDLRVTFPPHPWMDIEQDAIRAESAQTTRGEGASSPLLFPVSALPSKEGRQTVDAKDGA